MLLGFAEPVARKGFGPGDRILRAVGGLFGLAFFTLHFGGAHYVYGSMIDLMMPIIPDPHRVYVGKLTWQGVREFSILDTIGRAYLLYWPFVAVMLAHEYERLRTSPSLPSPQSMAVYKNVLKLHLLMFILMILFAIALESFPAYAIVFLLFFLPGSVWRALFNLRDDIEPESPKPS